MTAIGRFAETSFLQGRPVRGFVYSPDGGTTGFVDEAVVEVSFVAVVSLLFVVF